MIQKYIISILLVFNSLLLAKYEDSSPNKTTKDDLMLIKDFKKLSYNLSSLDSLSNCNIKQISNTIFLHKADKLDYSKLVVNLTASISNSSSTKDNEGTYQNRDKQNIMLKATYPLFDKKTDLEIKRKKLKSKKDILDVSSKYCTKKDELLILQNELDLLNLKQIRAKAREEAGLINLDERVKLLEEILIKKKSILKTKREIESIKLKLLNKIEPKYSYMLEDLL